MDKKFKSAFIKGSAATTLGTIASMGFHLFSIGILTRVLSKESFGAYIIFLVIVNFFNIFSGLGLNITLVKFISGEKNEENKASLRAIILARIYTLAVLTIIYYFLSNVVLDIFDLKITSLSIFIPIMFILSSFKDMFYNVLQGHHEYKKYAVIQISSALSRLLLIIAAVYLNKLTLENLILIEIFTSIISILIQISFVKIKELFRVKAPLTIYKSIFKFSFPIYLNSLLTFTYDRLSIFIIGIFLNPISVAIYDVGNKIPEALLRMFSPFIVVFFPSSSKLFSEGNHKAGVALMNRSMNIFSVVLALGTFVSFIFSKEIIILLFSEAYAASAFVFSLLMVALYLRVMTNIMGYSIVSAGFPKIPVKVNIVASIVNLSISVLAIPKYGYIGAVYALLIMTIISQVFYHIYSIKVKINPEGIKYLYPFFLLIAFIIAQYVINVETILLKIVLTILFFAVNWLVIAEFRQLIVTSLGYLKKIKSKLNFSV